MNTTRIEQLTDSTYLHSIPFDSAVKSLKQALSLAQQTENVSIIAKTYKDRGDYYYDGSRYRDALYNYHQAGTIFRKDKFSDAYLKIIIKLSSCYSYLSQPDSLLFYTTKGLSLVNEVDKNQRLLARLLDNMGMYYEMVEDYPSALTYYFRALDIVQKIDNPGEIAREKINIGIIYDYFGDTIKATKFYNEALEIGKHFGIEDVISACLSNLSSLKKDTTGNGHVDELKSMEIDKNNGDNYGIAISYNNIGVSKNDRGRYIEAKADYHKSYAMSKEFGFQKLEILNLFNLGYFFIDSTKYNDPDSAIYYLLKAENLSKKLNKKEDLVDILAVLQIAYQQKKDFKKAYQTAMAFEQMNSTVYTREKDKKLAEIMAKFESDSKGKQLIESHHEAQTMQLTGVIVSILFLLIIFILFIALRLWRLKHRKLTHQKQFANSLLEKASSYVLVLSKNLKIDYINPSFQMDFGFDEEEIREENLYEKLHPEDRILLKKQLDVVQKQGLQKAVFACKILNGKDEFREIMGIVSNKLQDTTLNGFLINFWDVTHLKANEKLLEEREKKYRRIFEAFPDIYFRENTDGILTDITPSVEIISGYKPEEVLGKSVETFFQSKEERWLARREIVSKGEIHDHAITLLKKDGTSIILSLNAKMLFDDNGIVNGTEGVLRDISEREKRVRQLQETNATKDKLFSIIAHDLVGPIGIQKNIIDLILRDIDHMSKEEIVPLITSMKPALDATFFMIENLLSWARIMRQSIEPRIVSYPVYKLVEQIFDFLQAQADRKSIKLIFKGDKEVKALFDKNLLDIALRNLITNAMKFSPEGSPVTVTAEIADEKVRISVIDQGIGIPSDILKNLQTETHKSYSRLGTKNEKGTGIGLIIVKEFIHKNSSQLTIKSELEKGSAFTFELPLA